MLVEQTSACSLAARKETAFMESEELMDVAKDMKWEKKLDEINAQQKSP